MVVRLDAASVALFASSQMDVSTASRALLDVHAGSGAASLYAGFLALQAQLTVHRVDRVEWYGHGRGHQQDGDSDDNTAMHVEWVQERYSTRVQNSNRQSTELSDKMKIHKRLPTYIHHRLGLLLRTQQFFKSAYISFYRAAKRRKAKLELFPVGYLA